MSEHYDSFKFEHKGRKFLACVYYDDHQDAPWERNDGHGSVSDWTRRDKKPGELVLTTDRNSKRFYDYAETMHIARRDGWGLDESAIATLTAKHGRTPTQGEITAEAVRRDFEYLRGWCNDEWSYCGVGVRALNDEGEAIGDEFTHALWGIESCEEDYIREVASDLASDILSEEDRNTYPVSSMGV